MKKTKSYVASLVVIAAVLSSAVTMGWANITNTASAAYKDSLNNNYTATSNNVTVTVISAPNVTLTKSASPTSVSAGAQVTFTIAYNNTGGAATNVVITDVIPANSTFVTGSIVSPSGVTGAISGTTITWTIPTLAAGATGSVSFKVTAN